MAKSRFASSLDLNLITGAAINLGGFSALTAGHLLGMLDGFAVFAEGCDASGPEGVITDIGHAPLTASLRDG